MKKIKLLMPIAAASVLATAIPAMSVTSCGNKTATKPTKETWNAAFETLNKRPDGICWHTTAESYFTYGDATTYEKSTRCFKYSNIECGQSYSKVTNTNKIDEYTSEYDMYSSMNLGLLDLNVRYDAKNQVIDGSSAATLPAFQEYILGFLNIYQPYYDNYEFKPETNTLEWVGKIGDSFDVKSLAIKINDSKIESIKSVAYDGKWYVGIDLNFTYDKTDLTPPAPVDEEFVRNTSAITTSTDDVVTDTYSEDGITRGFILSIKPTSTFDRIKATYATATTKAIFGEPEIYKNDVLLTANKDYEVIKPVSVEYSGIKFTSTINKTDVVKIGFNLDPSIYHGGESENISIELELDE